MKFEKMVRLTVRQLKLAPLARYHYYLPGRYYDAFLEWPGAAFQELFAPRPPLPDGWLDRLVACERLRNVSEIAFTASSARFSPRTKCVRSSTLGGAGT